MDIDFSSTRSLDAPGGGSNIDIIHVFEDVTFPFLKQVWKRSNHTTTRGGLSFSFRWHRGQVREHYFIIID